MEKREYAKKHLAEHLQEAGMINVGDMVRVKVEGKFHDQVVKVLKFHRKPTSISYLLDVKWDETPRPSWFDENEIEPVKERK